MKKPYILVLLITISFLLSCNSVHEKEKSAKDKVPNSQLSNTVSNQTFTTDLDTLTKDFVTWYNYTYNNVLLSEDFIGVDTDLQTIDKKTFLDKLTNENVVPFRTKIANGQSVY